MPESESITKQVCCRCDHSWFPRSYHKPMICPKCKSPYWDRPRRSESEKPNRV